jgi:IS5 family transposase
MLSRRSRIAGEDPMIGGSSLVLVFSNNGVVRLCAVYRVSSGAHSSGRASRVTRWRCVRRRCVARDARPVPHDRGAAMRQTTHGQTGSGNAALRGFERAAATGPAPLRTEAERSCAAID